MLRTLSDRCRLPICSALFRLTASIALVAAGLFAPPASALEPADRLRLEQAQEEVGRVGSAIWNWATDQTLTPGGPAAGSVGSAIDVTTVPVITRAALEAVLVPAYIDEIPDLDPWGNPYEYRFDPAWSGTGSFGGARSAGADGMFDGTVYTVGDNVTPEEDFLRWDGVHVRRLGHPFLSLIEAEFRVLQDVTILQEAVFDWLAAQGPVTAPAGALGSVDLTAYEPISAAALRSLLAGFLSRVPHDDGWGHPYDYYFDPDPPFTAPFFAVRSRGRDGVSEGDVYPIGTYPAIQFDRDVVFADFVAVQMQDSFDELIFVDGFESGDERFWSALIP